MVVAIATVVLMRPEANATAAPRTVPRPVPKVQAVEDLAADTSLLDTILVRNPFALPTGAEADPAPSMIPSGLSTVRPVAPPPRVHAILGPPWVAVLSSPLHPHTEQVAVRDSAFGFRVVRITPHTVTLRGRDTTFDVHVDAAP
jgi:hypothetical protein